MKIGSDEHKNLFCRLFNESHRNYEPARPLPALAEASLRALWLRQREPARA